MDFDAEQWTNEVGGALRAQNISKHAAAQELHVSPATFTSWMNGNTRPAVEKLPALSELTGINQWRMWRLAGYLPDSYDPATVMADAVQQQTQLYHQIQDWTARSLESTGLTVAAHIAGLLLKHRPTLSITLRQNRRGVESKVAVNTVLRIEPTDGTSIKDLRSDLLRNDPDDSQRSLGAMISALGGTLRVHQNPFGWSPEDAVLLDAPEHARTRPHSELFAEVEGLDRTIVVLGTPYSHAELLASLLAEALGYGYVNTRAEACASHKLNIGTDEKRIAKLSRKRLLDICADPGRQPTVHGFSHPDLFQADVYDRIAHSADGVTFVHVSAGPKLLKRGAEVWGLSEEACIKLENELTQLEKSTAGTKMVRVEIDDAKVFRDRPEHRIIDATIDATTQVLNQLGVPIEDRHGMFSG
ncbi:helix-turn-helix domain-containing protein [Mycobacteroides abscessus]|uniref:helix-turn-helix domain-containing protein n=1 Tax=Mycobacteroides abscessus TaxID=36809 RepID=UPI0009A695C9|nr:helix-turn-helix transcriptional regulator [Mycobacteroides abscessus]RIT48800.1 XRE family transcriptional regulator [Mycobacteroides abscessus]SKT87905.1 Uncharacterised protein [Mycobacteroides abscessus subsp. massiliense]SKU07592.1 Uncharacterised protein [Mycobacteroides abscessus subsp. massiliense]